jgi:hypothetical protein
LNVLISEFPQRFLALDRALDDLVIYISDVHHVPQTVAFVFNVSP